MLTQNQKIFSVLILISITVTNVLFLNPQKVSAFLGIGDVGTSFDPLTEVATAEDAAVQTEDAAAQTAGTGGVLAQLGIATDSWYMQLLDEVLMAVARKALGEITKSTLGWINSGFHGSPLFIENPGSFFNDIAKSEIKNIVDTFGYDKLKFPFGRDFALNTIATYKSTLENNSAYTLSNVIKDSTVLHQYQNDFNFGGWNGFLINTQYPQNNYLGFQMTATEELAKKVQGTAKTAVQKVQDILQQGQGFLSPQKCMDEGTNYNNGVNEFQKPLFPEKKYRDEHPSSVCTDQDCLDRWARDYEKAKEDWAKDNTCKNLVNTTPGSVVSNQITMALGSQFRQSELGAAMGNSLSAIFDALLNKFLGDGLNSLASKKNPEPVDNWTYDGQSLSGPGDSDWASGPDQEVILRDFRILVDGKTLVTFKENQQLLNENGEKLVYGDKNPIICKDGDKIIDSDGNTIEFCTRGEQISCNTGEKIISKDHYEDNVGIACIGETIDGRTTGKIQYHTPGGPVLAEGGEVVTLVGDKSIKRDPNTNQPMLDPVTRQPIPILGREYFPGGLENTIQETAIIDNPCEPNDDKCKDYDYTVSNPNYGLFTPGINQLFKPVIESTKKLDQCIPGPDKGWEKRLNTEYMTQKRKLDAEAALKDELTARAAKSMLSDLKSAVKGFEDWIKEKMDISIPGAMVYLDAVNEIDDIAQQSQELIDVKKEKVKAITRLNIIKKSLDKIASDIWNNPDPKDPEKKPLHLTQPKSKSQEETEMIKLKKEYDAIQPLISSSRSLDDTNKKLQILKDKLYAFNHEANDKDSKDGLIPKCLAERTKLRTGGSTGNIWTKNEPPKSDQPIEPFGICKKQGAVEKISHVTEAQCSQIEQYDENGDKWDWDKSPVQRADDLIGTCKNSDGNIIKEDVSRAWCLLLLQGVPNVLDETNYFCTIPINNGYSHGTTIRRSDAGYCTNVGHDGSGSCDHVPIHLDGSPASLSSDIGSWFVFRNNRVVNGINRYTYGGKKIVVDDTGTKIKDESGKILMDYGELPMVNAVDIEGDGTNNNWISINIGCDTIMKAKETDYTHAGDTSY